MGKPRELTAESRRDEVAIDLSPDVRERLEAYRGAFQSVRERLLGQELEL